MTDKLDIHLVDEHGWTQLCDAAYDGNIENSRKLISMGADIDKPNNKGYTPLYIAAQEGHKHVVEFLCSQGADIKQGNHTSCREQHQRNRNGSTNCHHSIDSTNKESNMTDKLDINWVDEEGRTQLYIAARDGNLVTSRDLLSMGADIDKTANNGCAPLHLASQNGHTDVVEVLCSQGADLNKSDYSGFTPLFIAALKGHVDVVEVLCSQGADLNKPSDSGATPLFIAALKGHVDVVEVLCSQGADLNKPANDGCTPLFLAAQEGHVDVVEVLCSQGANINQANENGDTPLTMAISFQRNDVEQVLRAHGASIPTDELVVETVDDVVQFFKRLNIRPEKIPQMEKKIKEDKIDAKTLFSIPDGQTMLTSLGVSEMSISWANAFYRLVKNHEKIQKDRKQTDGVAERAPKALEKMDNEPVRKCMYKLQRDFFHDYIQLVLPRLQTHGQDEISQKLTKGRVEATFKHTVEKIRKVASDEESRLGCEVIEVCLDKYKALKERWSLLEHLPVIPSDKSGTANQLLIPVSVLQRDFFHDYIQLVLPRLQTHGQDKVSQKLTKGRVEETFIDTIDKIREEASKEQSRLGSEVIEVCLDKYKALEERWSLLEHLPKISSDKSRNCQPIANTSFGVSEGEPSPFGSTKGNNPNLERLEHLVFLSRGFAKFFERQMELITRKVNNAKNPQALGLHHDEYMKFFERQMELITGKVNNAKNPQALGLHHDEYMLPFNDNLTATGGKRAHLTMGPIKKAERALKKAKEYEEEMNRGDKDTEINGIQVLSPADYVIDFLRCTIEVEDPYLVAVVFAVLLKEEVATCLQICRAKNKFMDKKLPRHIQTNVLMNLALIYPHDKDEFEVSGLVGDFDSAFAGRCMMVCELQITMKDFLHIKRLQHAYYDITRAEVEDLPNLLLTEGVFIEP
eukprot:CAMPEP_0185740894 /NCGR_PEP_ID=MMETSP1171-20130828/38665_1 /TAXON_ID=374046 /ORGANISM="Helicotheca tamensis, Strain CCMP826" /LENGTH=914 /DNA_ID=CAMNT_0028412825 /DNA_START=214 /DNA_END=2956 /DNA_ORIENTATION=-